MLMQILPANNSLHQSVTVSK